MDRTGPVSQVDLAAEFGVTSASMSTMADRLLTAGYITRVSNPASRRQNLLELTPKGRKLIDGIAAAWTAVDAAISDALGKDAATFFRMARQLRDNLGSAVPMARAAVSQAPDR